MTPSKRQWLSAAASVVCLAVGTSADWLLDMLLVTSACYVLGILATSLDGRRGAVLWVAGFASVLLLTPLIHTNLISTETNFQVELSQARLLSLTTVWLSASLLVWDPNRGGFNIGQLHRTFDQAPTGMVTIGADNRVLIANAAFCSLIDIAPKHVSKRLFSEIVGATFWEKLIVSPADSIQLDTRLIRPDGKTIWVSAYRKSFRAKEDLVHIIQITDLSEARKNQKALLQSETRFRNIVENSAELMLILDKEGLIRYANNTATQMLENDHSLVGHNFEDFVASDDLQKFKHVAGKLKTHSERDIRQLQLVGSAENFYVEVRLTNQLDVPGIRGTFIMCRVISRQIEAARQLRDSEARFSTIFQASPDAMLIIRKADSRVIDFNAGFTELLGYEREEAIGETEMGLNIWANANDRLMLNEHLAENQEVLSQDSTLRHKSGDFIHAEISARFVEIDGEVCVLCIGRDVTTRLKAEQALRDSEEKFARVFTNTPDGIIIIRSSDGVITEMNDVFFKDSGYVRADFIGKSVLDLPVFADPGDLEYSIKELAKHGSYTNHHSVFILKNGDQVPTLVSSTVLDISGEPHVLTIIKDMSEQRQAEEQLRTSEERFRGAFENAPIGMMLIDTQGRIFRANRYAAEMLNFDEATLLNVHISRLVPKEDRANLKETLERLSLPNNTVSKSERRLVCQNGLEIWTNFHVVVQRDGEGKPAYFVAQLADITEMKHSRERMEKMAFYDTLTNLANRRLFSDRLKHAILRSKRANKSAALLYLDLDQFKRINDTLGHEAGDELLRQVAQRLQKCVRKEDTVARPGGDEFTILLYDIRSNRDASVVAEKILQAMQVPITVGGQQIVITTSIGITLLPDDSEEANTLTRNADLAMYRAKDRGRNNYQFFSEDMNVAAVNQLKIESELRSALKNNEFILYYQPKIDIKTLKLTGVECLIRWNHPSHGILSPDSFISIAEESGVIVELGAWVLQQACRDGQRLASISETPIVMAINISPRQFRDPTLVNNIKRSLRASDLHPSQIELEITETMLMHDVDAASVMVETLHNLGVKLAIDDFGTGYSSLNYLKRFPIDTVKVDRSFVTDIPDSNDDMAITAAIIAMAHRLNMKVVAEGVETAEQLNFLRDHNCEYAQGYLFSKPVPLDEIENMLAPNLRLLKRDS